MPFTVVPNGSDGYTKLSPPEDVDGEFLVWVSQNFNTAATLSPTYAVTAGTQTFTGTNAFSNVIVGSGGYSGTTRGLSGALSVASISSSGAISAPELQNPSGDLTLSADGDLVIENGNATVRMTGMELIAGIVTCPIVQVTEGSAPASPISEGTVYFNSTDKHFYGWNGTAWKQLDN